MMKRGKLIDKGIAAAVTTGFLAAVRPDAEPERWSVALLAILLFEGIRWSAEYIRKANAKQRRRQATELNLKAREEDGKRWADEWIRWPIKEVS